LKPLAQAALPTSLAPANLRGVVIIMVLAFHSVLAYLKWIPDTGSGFAQPPFDWRSFPIIDSHRFFGFDLFCAWQDVDLMSLMFLLSGLFVWPSLTRKKDWGFLRDRLIRLGVPYIFGIAVVVPIGAYPIYRLTAIDPSVAAYLHAFMALPFWPNGPLWFLWQLLVLNVAAVALHRIAPDAFATLGRWSAAAGTRFGRYFATLLAISALAYLPLALAFTPWAWSDSGPFAIQFCRPLHYAVYFFAGVGLGVAGIERGLLAAAAALASLLVWMCLTYLTLDGHASIGVAIATDLAFVLACATGCFFLIALCLRFATSRWRILDILSVNAYGLYLVHYVFVVWLQYALLSAPLLAVGKAAIVFGGTLCLSLATVLTVQRIPFGAWLIGAVPRAAVAP
jgi:acyltransferase-like protein